MKDIDKPNTNIEDVKRKNAGLLMDALGGISEDLVPEMELRQEMPEEKTAKSVKKTGKSRKAFWIKTGIAAAAVALVVALVLPKVLYKKPKMLLAEPVYPEMVQKPVYDLEGDREGTFDHDAYSDAMKKWRASREELADQPEGYNDGFNAFLEKSTGAFAGEAGEDENFLYSPLSLYLAMSIAAESSGGETRQQFLDLLGVPDIETLRVQVGALFLSNYVDDGYGKCVLGNSIWLNDRFSYEKDTVERIATMYYASVYSGDPMDDKYTEAFHEWLNSQTGGLLEDYVKDIPLQEGTDPLLLMIASTINFNGKWFLKFDKALSREDTFHANTGDIRCDFMYKVDEKYNCAAGKNFAAVELPMDGNGKMRLILPDEGYTVQDLLSDGEFITFLNNSRNGELFMEAMTELTIPMFDISCKNDMAGMLQSLGVTDAFDEGRCDMSSIVDMNGHGPIKLDKVEQDVRVKIDEEGCSAAAVTVMAVVEQCLPSEYYHLKFDRPFIFEIFSENGALLFVGVVNQPIG